MTHEQFRGAKVLITGATGFTGKVLTKKLATAGAKISAIARPSSKTSELDGLGITWFRGDIADPELVRQAAVGAEYIFHLATAFRAGEATEEDCRSIHLRPSQLMAQAVQGRPEFKRFVYASTVGVHGHIPGGQPADEQYRFSPGDCYQSTKLETEQWLTASGLPCTIIRPVAILGPGEERMVKMFRLVNKGLILMLGKGKGRFQLIHVDDLTEIILLAAAAEQTRGEVLIAANAEPLSIIDMGQIIAKALNRRALVVRLPIQPFYLAADLCETVCAPFGLRPPLYRRRVAFYDKDRQFCTAKLHKLLNYRFRHSNESTLTETAQWYQRQGWL
ncbi:MAG: NAD-dependent epimerase/dehydratase family protein [Candidatus Electronema sp. V4]|uniref:NAD-dependent epimerase/dehydratase family protein n=1 Tax=Candidatus Electronema sp. V4 TaxID=3454756 RepID=UPI0040557E8F